MNLDEIRSKFISGTGWSVFLSAITIAVSFVVNTLLGRQGPEVLGVYALLTLMIALVPVLFLYGGNPVLVRFLPRLPAQYKGSFIIGYSLVVLGFGLAGTAVILVKPSILALLLDRSNVDRLVLYWLAAITPIVLLENIASSGLQSIMEIKWVSVANAFPSALTLAIIGVFIFVCGPFARIYQQVLMTSLFLAHLVVMLLLTRKLVKEIPLKTRRLVKPSLPEGFWKYSFFVHLTILAEFVFQKADQFLMFGFFQTSSLGIYKAALLLSEFVRWFPLVMIGVIFPMFSNLIAQEANTVLQTSFRRVVRFNVYIASMVAMFCILFGPELLSIFGSEYGIAYPALAILASTFLLSSLTSVCSSIILAAGRADIMLISGVISALTQVGITLTLVDKYGPTAIVVGRSASLWIASLTLSIASYYLHKVKPPFEFAVILFVCVGLAVLVLFLPSLRLLEQSVAIRAVAFLVFPGTYVLARTYHNGELGLFWTEFRRRFLSETKL